MNIKAYEQVKLRQASKLGSISFNIKDLNEEYFEEFCRLKVANHILLDRV